MLKREDYPNITYWFRHEYFSALAEDKVTSVDDAPVKVHGAEHAEADDDDDDDDGNDGNGEDGTGVHEQSSGAPKGKRGKGRALQGQNVKMRYLQHENGDVVAGEPRTYANLQGQFLLDSHCKGKCFKAGSK